ncbi:MAG: amidohydrolase [Oscillospiraceae bacterium]|jgi:hippurate hydrolase|nr:amidohydrolase [Oscillospiraceae bacterium]
MLSEYRRALHQIPELDKTLPKTAAYLRKVLESLPCTLLAPCGDAVCAYFDFGKAETIAFRSDMDALPIAEQTDAPYASTHLGCMHACGHDGHMAIVLGLAQHLSAHPEEASRNVLLVFQPAEESSGGALEICETGIFEKYNVTRIYGLHLWPELEKNTVSSMAGGMMARSVELTMKIYGRSVHLARYEDGADALLASVRLVQALYDLVQGTNCLLRFGKLESGSVRNAVSDFSSLEGSIRCFDDALFEDIWAKAQAIAKKIAAQTGCEIVPTRSCGYPPMANDAALLAQARARFPIAQTQPTYLTEDFSEYQRRVPGVFFLLGTGGEPLHSPHFDFDESVLETGLSLFRALL